MQIRQGRTKSMSYFDTKIILGQGSKWQALVWYLSPEQLLPPYNVLCLSFRVRWCCPSPQLTEHSVQTDHGPNSQLTKKRHRKNHQKLIYYYQIAQRKSVELLGNTFIFQTYRWEYMLLTISLKYCCRVIIQLLYLQINT